MTDRNELRSAYVRKGLNQQTCADMIGISRYRFSRKEHGGEFTASELLALTKGLEMSDAQISRTFFGGERLGV